MILVDTNVLVDITADDPIWGEWSQRRLSLAAARDQLVINDVVYAELSVGYPGVQELDRMLVAAGVVLAPIPRTALFLAGKVFQRYRQAGGIRTGVLPDFFIGAHAVTTSAALITRDVRHYRTYFPGITLIAPS